MHSTSPMKNLTRTICLTLAVLLGSAGTSWGGDLNKALAAAQSGDFKPALRVLLRLEQRAADFDKGLAAYDSGDYKTAVREWSPLAEQGIPAGQFVLGLMHFEGKGVPQDYKTAVKWYTLAAEQGIPEAQDGLGLMHIEGKGVLQDYKTALKWYTLAAEQGYARSQVYLGFMYVFGYGVIKDNVYAHMWANIAASNGNKTGNELRELTAKKMTPAQIEKAQELARECIAKKYKGC